jgi:hypothetical protein
MLTGADALIDEPSDVVAPVTSSSAFQEEP